MAWWAHPRQPQAELLLLLLLSHHLQLQLLGARRSELRGEGDASLHAHLSFLTQLLLRQLGQPQREGDLRRAARGARGFEEELALLLLRRLCAEWRLGVREPHRARGEHRDDQLLALQLRLEGVRLDLQRADVRAVAPGRVGNTREAEWPRPAALVGGQPERRALVDRRARDRRELGPGRAAVVLKRSQLRVLTKDVRAGLGDRRRRVDAPDQREAGPNRLRVRGDVGPER